MTLEEAMKRAGIAVENFSIGAGHGIQNQMEGLYQLLSNPAAQLDTWEGLKTAVSNPRQTLEGALQYGRQAASSPLNAGQFVGEVVDPRALANMLRNPAIMREMTAYHGSPHKFDKFELSDRTIGTGEGAQAYGHGLYFAEDPKVAGQYRDTFSQRLDHQMTPELEALLPTKSEVMEMHDLQQKLNANAYRNGPPLSQAESARWSELYAKSRKYQDAVEASRPKANLYHVDIPDSAIANMLDWDAPLSEQPPQAEAVLRKFNFIGPNKPLSEIKGGSLGLTYTNHSKLSGFDARRFSKEMADAGVPGIRYFDGGSRKAGEGTRNFVVFDDSILKILNRE